MSVLQLSSPTRKGFALVELLIAVMIVATVFVTVYVGIAECFTLAQVDRENIRATQILQDKTETLRLYTWEQLSNSIPSSFSEAFYPPGASGGQGIAYTGTVAIASAPVTETYSNDLRLITITLNWKSAGVNRQRQFQTLVSHYGLHNYIYR
jgi:prepilin-type N-terminal cleavage/methylation domain-containing protein